MGAKNLKLVSLVSALLLLASMGCQQTTIDPAQQIDSQLLVQRGQIRFVADSVQGRQFAKQQGLPCLLFFTADWCTYCHQMEATAFVDPTITKLAKNFVCILVDADRESNVCQQFGIQGYPTVQFLAADGHSLHRLVGRQTTPKLAAGMQAALQRIAWLGTADRKQR